MPLIAEIVPPKPDGRTLADLPPGTLCEVNFGEDIGRIVRYRDSCNEVWGVEEGFPDNRGRHVTAYKVRRIIGRLKFTHKAGKLTVEIVPFEEPQRTLMDLEPWEWARCNHPDAGKVLRCRSEKDRILKLSPDGVPVELRRVACPSHYIVDWVEGQLRVTVEGEWKGT